MRRLSLCTLMLFSTIAPRTWAGQQLSCERSFAAAARPPNDLKRVQHGLLKLPSGRHMYREYWPGDPGKTVFVLQHGLGDSLDDMKALARKFRDEGFGVLLVDHHAHGSTLDAFRGRHPMPESFDYKDDVEDVISVIRHHGLKEISLVGHSRGGGLVLAEAPILENELKLVSVHQMAPYVMRLDVFAQRQAAEGKLFFDAVQKEWVKAGVPEEKAKEILQPWRDLVKEHSAPAVKAGEDLNQRLGLQEYQDRVLDPFMDLFMKENYEKYFRMKDRMVDQEYPESQLQRLRDRIDAAIASTKGLRSYNVFSPEFRFPERTPVQLLMGEIDALVPRELMLLYAERMKELGHPSFSSGIIAGGGHLFPQHQTDLAFEKIMEAYREAQRASRK